MAEVHKWRKFANDIKAKRTRGATTNPKGKDSGGSSDVTILEKKELLVQPLATEATGKAKKYERTGPQEFVSYPYEELTIPNIIKACNKHFQKRHKGKSVDVLASERGPSCSKIAQLPNLKLIHVRFISNSSESSVLQSSLRYSEHRREDSLLPSTPPISVPCSKVSSSLKRRNCSPLRGKKFPKSLPVTRMMKLGLPINETELTDCENQTLIEVSTFDIDKMVWSAPKFIPFTIENEEFGKGGFRSAHKATSNSPDFQGKAYVVKYFLQSTKDVISELGETELEHARKSVQMQALAKRFAEQFDANVKKEGNEEVFGKTFRYSIILV
jgi:hypothetical protein